MSRFALLAAVLLLPGAALAAPAERLQCNGLDAIAFHEALAASTSDPDAYAAAQRSSWLDVPYPVGPALGIDPETISEISVTSLEAWRKDPRRFVLFESGRLANPPSELEDGVMVTFHFPLEEIEAVRATLAGVIERDAARAIGPDLVVTIAGRPLAGSALQGPDSPSEVSVLILERTLWEVTSYLSLELDCERN